LSLHDTTTNRDRVWAAIELVAVAAAIAGVTLFYSDLPSLVPLVALASISLWARGKSWSDMGLNRIDRGVIIVVCGVVVGAVAQLVLWWSAPALVDFNVLPQVRGSAEMLGTALLLVLVGSALAGEMVYRGYLFDVLDRLFADRRNEWVTLLLAAVVYGAATGGGLLIASLGKGAAGVGYGLLYRASGRNLVLPIAVHAGFESANLVLVYLGLT